jgi:hypothetical protein
MNDQESGGWERKQAKTEKGNGRRVRHGSIFERNLR